MPAVTRLVLFFLLFHLACPSFSQERKLSAIAFLARLDGSIPIEFEKYGIEARYFYVGEAYSPEKEKAIKEKYGGNYSFYDDKDFKSWLGVASLLYVGQFCGVAQNNIVHDAVMGNLIAVNAFLEKGGSIFFDYQSAFPGVDEFLRAIGVSLPSQYRAGKFEMTMNPACETYSLFNVPYKLSSLGEGYGWWEKWGKDQDPIVLANNDKTKAGVLAQKNVNANGVVFFSGGVNLFRRQHGGKREFLANMLSFIFKRDIGKPSNANLPSGEDVDIAAARLKKTRPNPLFLRKSDKLPWLKKGFKKRIPALVCENIGLPRTNTSVEFVFPDSENVSTHTICVTDAEGNEIPSQVITAADSKVEIVFLTNLRKNENKPIFIYLDYDGVAATERTAEDFSANADDDFIVVRNDKLSVQFWKKSARLGKINRIHINGAKNANELCELSSGGAWHGNSLYKFPDNRLYQNEFSTEGKIITDGRIKKSIRFEDNDISVIYSLYSYSNRIDYIVTPKKAVGDFMLRTAWMVGGDTALDRIYVEGLKGYMKLKGEADGILDDADFFPYYCLKPSLKEGWIGIEDNIGKTIVGQFFDLERLVDCRFFSQGHLNAGQNVLLKYVAGKMAVRGALVAAHGDAGGLVDDYREWQNPPSVLLGDAQSYSESFGKIPVPDFIKNVTRGYKVELHPLRDGERRDINSAIELVKKVKSFGANSIKLSLDRRWYYPLANENLDTAFRNDEFRAEYSDKGGYVGEIVKAAHARGVAVRAWQENYIGWAWVKHYSIPFDSDQIKRDIDDLSLLADTGIDYLFLHTGGEFHGKGFSDEFFDQARLCREAEFSKWAAVMSKALKATFPHTPLGILCSGSGSLSRYVDIEGQAPFLDSLETELIVGRLPNLTDIKYGVRYIRGVFGNDGRALQHHFYFYTPDRSYRLGDMELPLLYGIKSFCSESLANRYNNPELVEIVADFYRFISYTGLEDFIANAKPVKYVGVLRDKNAFSNDIALQNYAHMPEKMSANEAACKELSSLRNVPIDILTNRFCDYPALRPYKVIIIPDNPVIADSLALNLVKYVEGGGCVITEGASINNKILAEAIGIAKAGNAASPIDQGEPALFERKIGEGAFIYSPSSITSGISKSQEKAQLMKKLITRLVNALPLEILSAAYESVIDSNVLSDGKNYCVGFYNPTFTDLTISVRLNLDLVGKAYALDVKNGTKSAFNNEMSFTLPAADVVFFLIGDDEFTRVPHATEIKPNVTPLTQNEDKTPTISDDGPSSPPAGDSAEKNIGVFFPRRNGGKKYEAISQDYGAQAIFACLKEAKQNNHNVLPFHDISDAALIGLDVLVVPNMGPTLPDNLNSDWDSTLRTFVKRGGGVMLIHHAVGMVGTSLAGSFPEIGFIAGSRNNGDALEITCEHAVTAGLNIGDAFPSAGWAPIDVFPGNDGMVVVTVKDGDLSIPTVIVGKFGEGKVVLCGFGLGSGYRKDNGKYIKFEAPPEGKLRKLLLNAINWLSS